MKNFFVTALAAAIGFAVVYGVIYAFDSMKKQKATDPKTTGNPPATV